MYVSINQEMMELLLQFAQWKPSRLNKESHVRNGREIYENIIEMINNFKYFTHKIAKIIEEAPKRKSQFTFN
jgi:hypothetical protein